MDLLYAAHVPAGPGPFPTIVLLHGWGANAHDLLGLAPLLHGGEALVLCPQGPVAVPIGGGSKGYGWFPLIPGVPPDPASFHQGAAALRSFVAGARQRYPVDPERVALMGFSQGGVMAYDLGLRDPEHYCGIGALATWLPEILAENLEKRPAHAELPVLIVHGTEDPMVNIEKARQSRELLRPFGVTLTYREVAMGHEIRPEALRVVVRWLDEKAFGAGS